MFVPVSKHLAIHGVLSENYFLSCALSPFYGTQRNISSKQKTLPQSSFTRHYTGG